jgi:putative endonuclease
MRGSRVASRSWRERIGGKRFWIDPPMNLFRRIAARFAQWRKPLPLGARGERAAARYLQRCGYQIVSRSDRGKLGEIDLVAIDGRTIVFVEVKTRRSQAAGHPAEAVDRKKQRRLTRLALSYLKRYGLLEYPARFDVVAVIWPDDAHPPTIEHFRDAFDAVGDQGMFG